MAKTKRQTAGQRWRESVESRWDIPPDQTETLRLAAEALDRAEAAQAEIDHYGVLVDGLHQKVQNPALTAKKDAVREFLQLLNALGFEEDDNGPSA